MSEGGSGMDRLAMVERDLRDHSRSLSAFTENFQKLDARLLALEQAEINRQKQEAREEERDRTTMKWRDSVDARFAAINTSMSRLLWIVGTSVAVAFTNWLIKGGLFQ